MQNFRQIIAVLILLMLSHWAGSTPLADKFTPGTSYYFNDFDSEQQPWEPGQFLNFEEVFKNYQYYEIVFNQDGSEITVSRYLRGIKAFSERYQILPDNSLRKK